MKTLIYYITMKFKTTTNYGKNQLRSKRGDLQCTIPNPV